MTELERLKSRKELVVLAAELQRATIVRRLERVEANPARALVRMATSAVGRPAVLTLGTAALRYAVRAWKRRAARREAPKIFNRKQRR